jgi:serine protease Do
MTKGGMMLLLSRAITVTAILVLAAPAVGAQEAATMEAAPPTLTDISRGFESLSQRVNPSVVQVFSSGYTPTQDRASTEEGLLSKRQSTGSGVIVDPNGYIITNAHVVHGAQRVQVLMAEARGFEANPQRSVLKQRGRLVGAQVVGSDTETDIAVLKIEATDLPALELADSEELRQGQIVFAFGSPFGLENSVSMGVISATTRQLQPDAPMIYIQTDAVINPGNSGGPLVDTEGRVVGISTFILSQSGGSEGLGFAIPSNILKAVYGQIKMTGRVRRGWVGTRVQTITPELAAALSLPQNWGVVVSDVIPNTPAAKSGLQIGDVVTALDGKPMENGRQFNVNIYGKRIDDVVSVEVLRGGGKRSFEVSVTELRSNPRDLVEMVDPRTNIIPQLGILALEVNELILRMLPNLRRHDGAVVASGTSDNPYWKERFQPGDVIYSVNGKAITSLLDLRAEAAKLKSGDPVALHVERQGQLLFVAFEVK